MPEKQAEITDEMILELAQQIKKQENIPLTDAMIAAEVRLQPAPELQDSFEVPIKLKPRVAAWVIREFGGHPKFTIEERLGAYFSQVLNRTRVEAMRFAEDAPDIKTDGAVSMMRHKFQEKAGGI